MGAVTRQAIVAGLLLAASVAPAAAACLAGEEAARLVAVDGQVRVGTLEPATRGTLICAGEVVSVGPRSRASIYLVAADTVLRLDENSASRIAAPPEPEGGLVELMEGALYFLSQVRRSLTIRTPYVNAGVEGTEVLVVLPREEGGQAEVLVVDGSVVLFPGERPAGDLPPRLTSGEGVLVAASGATTRTAPAGPDMRRLLRERLAWTLFYPQVLTAAERAAHPRLAEAESLLGTGRAAEAGTLLAAAREAGGEEAALAAALQAIEAVARQDVAQALELAGQAREAAPEAAGPFLALSYARQIDRDLEGALQAAAEAAGAAPQSPLVQARLAELHLTLGQTGAARAAAAEAQRRGGGSLADVAQGFTALAALDADLAAEAFRSALAADSGLPSAHLGLGLALVKEGEVTEGRREMAIAAALAPNEALLRAWLGRAYMAERRDGDAGDQLAVARRLDPADPTPLLFDAMRKQLANRPVEALQDIGRSIRLNDNRALYRGPLLLEEDQAARGVALGRIYQDLGFGRLGMVEADRSLGHDPASAGAHRLLADLYQGRPRLEVARTSELLRSQLLDPFDTSPIQPSLPYIDLNTVAESGPARAGFNEFGPLFASDGFRFSGTGGLGNNATWTDEVALGGSAGRTTLSVGQYHYETDGFRRDADIRHDIVDIFAQSRITPELSVQAEYRRRDSRQGDIDLRFDPDATLDDQTRDTTQDTVRLGARWAPAPHSTFIASAIWSDRNEKLAEEESPTDVDARTDTDGIDLQGQYIFRTERAAFVTGGGLYRIERDSENRLALDLPPPFGGTSSSDSTDDIDQGNLYGYLDYRWPLNVTWTAGLAWDTRETDSRDDSRFGPKLGVRWEITPEVQLRAAYTETLKRDLLVDQTLEPTQVAGFNQLFDDFNGTQAKRLGIGLDTRLGEGVFAGAELSRRDLDVPVSTGKKSSILQQADERTASGYLYLTLSDRLAWRTEAVWDRYHVDGAIGNEPREVTTVAVPTGPVWFHPDGLFAGMTATFLWQDVERSAGASIEQGSDDTLLVDAVLGYRLPARRGMLSLEIRNLLDSSFNYQDENYRTRESITSGILPERTIFARLTLGF